MRVPRVVRAKQRCGSGRSAATIAPHEVAFAAGDWLVFGAESCGLPPAVLETFAPERRLRLPMRPGQRSLNLSNAVAVVAYEAWRQLGFAGAAPPAPTGGAASAQTT